MNDIADFPRKYTLVGNGFYVIALVQPVILDTVIDLHPEILVAVRLPLEGRGERNRRRRGVERCQDEVFPLPERGSLQGKEHRFVLVFLFFKEFGSFRTRHRNRDARQTVRTAIQKNVLIPESIVLHVPEALQGDRCGLLPVILFLHEGTVYILNIGERYFQFLIVCAQTKGITLGVPETGIPYLKEDGSPSG